AALSRVCDFPFPTSRLSSPPILFRSFRSQNALIGMIRMNQVVKCCLGIALFAMVVPAAEADELKLSNNQKISCSRGLAPGKLNTATCKSYTYVFNVKTSEYFRCQVSLALT